MKFERNRLKLETRYRTITWIEIQIQKDYNGSFIDSTWRVWNSFADGYDLITYLVNIECSESFLRTICYTFFFNSILNWQKKLLFVRKTNKFFHGSTAETWQSCWVFIYIFFHIEWLSSLFWYLIDEKVFLQFHKCAFALTSSMQRVSSRHYSR